MSKTEDEIIEDEVDKLPCFPVEEIKKEVVPPVKELKKPSVRRRIHYWLCDVLGVVSMDDFNDLFYMTDELGVIVFRKNKLFTEFVKTQHEFNVLINNKLRLDIKFEVDNMDRGMIQ